MKIGYARISTREQKLDMQIDALTKAGCEKLYTETVSGGKERPILNKMIEDLRPKDTIVIWKLDRLGRSLKHLVELVNELEKRDIGLLSLNDPVDTTTAQGRLNFNIFASHAEFEKDLIKERTNAGLTAARARGRIGGRPKGLSKENESTACAAETLYREGKLSVNQIAKQLGIVKATLYKYLRHRGVEINGYKKKAA